MKKFTSFTQRIGEIGERYAEKYLIGKGFKIFERNTTRKYGEIDIIAIKDTCVYYIEVKSMRQMSLIHANENLTSRKIETLTRMCNFHFNESMRPLGFIDWSLDAITVHLNESTKIAQIEYIKNINI